MLLPIYFIVEALVCCACAFWCAQRALRTGSLLALFYFGRWARQDELATYTQEHKAYPSLNENEHIHKSFRRAYQIKGLHLRDLLWAKDEDIAIHYAWYEEPKLRAVGALVLWFAVLGALMLLEGLLLSVLGWQRTTTSVLMSMVVYLLVGAGTMVGAFPSEKKVD